MLSPKLLNTEPPQLQEVLKPYFLSYSYTSSEIFQKIANFTLYYLILYYILCQSSEKI